MPASGVLPVLLHSSPFMSNVNIAESFEARLIRDLGLKTELAKAIVPVVLTNLDILDRKQQDYGSQNLLKFGPFGVVVRMNDKLERIINLMKKAQMADARADMDGCEAFNEPLADSFLDLANYALIAYVMQMGKWPAPAPVAPKVPRLPAGHCPNPVCDKEGHKWLWMNERKVYVCERCNDTKVGSFNQP